MGCMYRDRQLLILEICERLSEGEPLAHICRDPHMPGITAVWAWAKDNAEFSESIARAREAGFDIIAADCLEISNTPRMGTKVVSKEWGKEITEADMIEHRKLQIDTRLKLLAKWDPKRYGDKQQVELSGQVDTVATLIAARKRSGR